MRTTPMYYSGYITFSDFKSWIKKILEIKAAKQAEICRQRDLLNLRFGRETFSLAIATGQMTKIAVDANGTEIWSNLRWERRSQILESIPLPIEFTETILGERRESKREREKKSDTAEQDNRKILCVELCQIGASMTWIWQKRYFIYCNLWKIKKNT